MEVALFLQCKAREVSTLIRSDHEKNNSLLRLRRSCILILFFHSFIHLLVLFVDLKPHNVVKSRNSEGGTGFVQVEKEVNNWQKRLLL